jgi:hypothetical protein
MNKFKQIVVASFVALLAFDVAALPTSVSGSIDMIGGYPVFYDETASITTDASAAAKVVFSNPSIFIVAATGDLSSLIGDIGMIKDLPFDPFASSIEDFWRVDNFSFDLTSIERGITSTPETLLVLNGTGIIKDSSLTYADTAADWTFSADTSGSLFSWNASSASVPEPGILMLMSIGLMGFGLRKKIK